MDAPRSEHLSRQAIHALAAIILVALGGIIVLSLTGAALRYGVIGAGTPADTTSSADEALSILGNVASAAVGGLVGWLTRDVIMRAAELTPPPAVDQPAPLELERPAVDQLEQDPGA